MLSTFVRTWNDSLRTNEERSRLLKPFVPRLIAPKATPEVEKARSLLALDWLVRTFLPTWLEQVDALREHAAKVRSLDEIVDDESAAAAGDTVRAARDAARAAAWDAARAAARDAAGAAAGAALAPTVAVLQQSASDLLNRMLEAK